MKTDTDRNPDLLMDYFENHPKVKEIRRLIRQEYARFNYSKASQYAAQLNKIKESIEKSFVEDRTRLIDLKNSISEEDNHILALKVNKLIFLCDMIDEAIFSIGEIMKKYNSRFVAFDDFKEAARLGKKHIYAFMKDGSDTVQDMFIEFTEDLNNQVDKIIEDHIFMKDKEEEEECSNKISAQQESSPRD